MTTSNRSMLRFRTARGVAAGCLTVAMLTGAAAAQKTPPPLPPPLTPAAAPKAPPADGAPTAPAAPRALPTPPAEPPTGPIISVDFKGGTLRAYVNAVRDAAERTGQGVNIILPKQAEEEEIGSISLTQVSVTTALQALSFAFPDGTFQVASKSIGTTGDQSLTFAVQYANRRAAMPGQPVFQQPPPQRISRVYSLRSLVEMPDGLTPDPSLVVSVPDVLSALQAAAELEAKANDDPRSGERPNSPPEFLLHKESNLLICRGTENQQRLVESMLTELRESIMPKRARAGENAKNAQAAEVQKIAVKAELQQSEVEVKRARDQFESIKNQFDQIKKRAEAGIASTTEVEEARRAASNAQSNLEQANAAYEAARAKAELLTKQLNMMPAGAMPAMPMSGDRAIPITYEIKDLEALWKDLYAFCRQAIPGKWDEEGVYSQEAGRNSVTNIVQPRVAPSAFVTQIWKNMGGKMTLNATPAQHKMITQYLNTVRRAKANEPNLPGLNADQLIQGATDAGAGGGGESPE